MVVALYHNQLIFFQIFVGHKPRLTWAAYAQTFALAQGVKHQANVLTHLLAFRRAHHAIVGGQVLLQKFAKRALANKADAGAVFFGSGGQGHLGGNAAHFRLFHVAQWEDGFAQLVLIQAV